MLSLDTVYNTGIIKPPPMVELGRLPNLRRLIIPDKGKILIDGDLNRADVYGVAYESGDEALKEKLREEQRDPSKDLHTQNCLDIYGVVTYEKRRFSKIFCHAADYGATAYAIARQIGVTQKETEFAMGRWFGKHPEIPKWHGKVETTLRATREIRNPFGFRRKFFDRIESCRNEALAWSPQSTVAHIINVALCEISENHRWIEILLQVHDSLTNQADRDRLEEALVVLRAAMSVTIPYPNEPLIIPVGFSVSDKSWGHVESSDYWRAKTEYESWFGRRYGHGV